MGVADREGKPLQYSVVERSEGGVSWFCVLPELRRRGHGKSVSSGFRTPAFLCAETQPAIVPWCVSSVVSRLCRKGGPHQDAVPECDGSCPFQGALWLLRAQVPGIVQWWWTVGQ